MQITKIIEIIWELWNELIHLDLTFPGNGPWKITHGPGSRSGPVSRSLGPGSRCGAGRGGVGASSAGHQGRTHCSAAGKSTEIDGENDSFHRFSGNRQRSVVFWHPLALRCREKTPQCGGIPPAQFVPCGTKIHSGRTRQRPLQLQLNFKVQHGRSFPGQKSDMTSCGGFMWGRGIRSRRWSPPPTCELVPCVKRFSERKCYSSGR